MSPVVTRIPPEEGLELLREGELVELGRRAHEVRLEIADPQTVTYVVDRNINYSNVCTADCDFCAFYRKKNDPGAYVLDDGELSAKLQELVDVGGTTVLLQGGLSPTLPFSYYIDLVRKIKEEYGLYVHGFSAPEIAAFHRLFKRPVRDILIDLQAAGLDGIPGGGAEILHDEVRGAITRGKCNTAQWLEVMETAHGLGMATTATMMFGHVETCEHRIAHLEAIRQLQDRTGGFTAFICWTFQPYNTRMSHILPAGGHAYLRQLAVSRLYLDNFPHVQASFVTQGMKVGQLSLFWGADDMGGTMLEENVVKSAGTSVTTNERQLRRIIEDAGFRPQKRTTRYEWIP